MLEQTSGTPLPGAGPTEGFVFNTPPGWPPVPHDWTPPPGWQPHPSWPPAPPGWQLWLPAGQWAGGSTSPGGSSPGGTPHPGTPHAGISYAGPPQPGSFPGGFVVPQQRGTVLPTFVPGQHVASSSPMSLPYVRNTVIGAVSLVVAVAIALAVHSGSTPALKGYNDPVTLPNSIAAQVTARQTDGSSVSVTCIHASGTQFTCHSTWSDNTPDDTFTATVSPDGTDWITGQ